MTNSGNGPVFEVTFWGTRGTLPAPGQQFARAGGNTNCTEVSCGDQIVVFDAGTGIRELGSRLAAERPNHYVHLLLTHAHYDHVEGVPFFAPFFMDGSKVDVYCGELDGSTGTMDTVLNLMRRPYFPVGPNVFTADVRYIDLKKNASFSIANKISVRTIPLNHPGGATGYRLDCNGRSFACVTDTEHKPGRPDPAIVEFIRDVDAFIYDTSLTDEEFPDFSGYGHSTFEEGLRLQNLANAGALVAFHHMPFRTDMELDEIERMLKRQNPLNRVAREGEKMSI